MTSDQGIYFTIKEVMYFLVFMGFIFFKLQK